MVYGTKYCALLHYISALLHSILCVYCVYIVSMYCVCTLGCAHAQCCTQTCNNHFVE